MVARYGEGARILNELINLSSLAVLMLCDSCPTCKAADREYRKAITEGIADNEPTIIVPRTDATTPNDKPAAWHRSVAQRIREATGCKLVYSPETTTPTDQDKD